MSEKIISLTKKQLMDIIGAAQNPVELGSEKNQKKFVDLAEKNLPEALEVLKHGFGSGCMPGC